MSLLLNLMSLVNNGMAMYVEVVRGQMRRRSSLRGNYSLGWPWGLALGID